MFMRWAFAAIVGLAGCQQSQTSASEPRGTLHRLNATEYDNTVRTLLGTSQRPAERFPTDGALHGFDNVSAALTISPVMVDLHEMAIDTLLTELFEGVVLDSTRRPVDAEAPHLTQQRGGEAIENEGYWMRDKGDVVTVIYVDIPYDGHYIWEIELFEGTGHIAVRVDGFVIYEDQISGAGTHPVPMALDAGYRVLDLALTQPSLNGIFIDVLTLDGPFAPKADANDRYGDILSCDPEPDPAGCARTVIADFGRLAWRRPLTSGEVESFGRLYGEATTLGLGWDESVKAALKAILFSPEFLFRVEDLFPEPGPPLLDDHAIASRLSYFLWSTSPDAELAAAADAGQLSRPDEIAAQVQRMLADPKAVALIDNFAGQWWGINQLVWALPDSARWDDSLRMSFINELEFLAGEFLLEGRSMREILLFDETHGNERLAEHYEIDYPDGGDWVTLDLTGSGRRGLFTTGGFLTINGSEVLRGKAVMEQLLCTSFPPPPPGAADSGPEAVAAAAGSLRERIEATRTYNPDCTGCHQILDPIGFTLGAFDPAGSAQETDIYGFEIDTSGSTPDGTPVADATELTAMLADDPDFVDCIVEKTLTYALGRAPTRDEDEIVAQITADFVESGYKFEDLAVSLATSGAFRSNAFGGRKR